MTDSRGDDYQQMKAVWHEVYGGSVKHDHPSEEFAEGWTGAMQAIALFPKRYCIRAIVCYLRDMTTTQNTTEQDIQQVHPDYPTQPEALNVLYREHTQAVADYFRGQSEGSEAAIQALTVERDAVAYESCPLAIHGKRQATPNGACPWCEWETLERENIRLKAERDALAATLTKVKAWRYNWFEPAGGQKVRPHVRRLDELLTESESGE